VRIGFTGTRRGMSLSQAAQLEWLLDEVPGKVTEFHHGCAIGADREAAALVAARAPGAIREHPAGDDPLARNRDIVDACDILVAAPRWDREELRSGTWMTVRLARKKRIPVLMLSR
jgi:hypothetical protein